MTGGGISMWPQPFLWLTIIGRCWLGLLMARELDKDFQAITKDNLYYLELRTDLYLRDQIFEDYPSLPIWSL